MLDALGNIGDLLGGVGVVVTLLYLASQIRQNTRSVQTSAFQSVIRDLNDILDRTSGDPELTRIFFDGQRDFASFSREDRRRFALIMTSLLRRYENLLHQTRMGTIDPSSWEGLEWEIRRVVSQPGTQAWWTRGREAFNAELRDYVDHLDTDPKIRPPAA